MSYTQLRNQSVDYHFGSKREDMDAARRDLITDVKDLLSLATFTIMYTYLYIEKSYPSP